MKLYSVDVLVCATAYVKAETEAEARAKLAALHGDGLEVFEDSHPETDLTISGREFARMGGEDVADVTLSPAMTFHGPAAAKIVTDPEAALELAHDFDEG